MAKIQQVQSNMFDVSSDAYVIPVPARVRKKLQDSTLLEITNEAFERYKLSFERYKEISETKDPYDNGEIYIVRDADFNGMDIQDPNVDVQEVIKIIENESSLVVLLPIKTREDKEISEQVYLSSLRSLYNLISSDEEVKNQISSMSIPAFPGILDQLSKIEDIFEEIEGLEVFICLD